jgi:ABC-type lipoprotein release transport system permease subunit
VKILILAWRNVFRHRRRTLITAAAISVGLAAMITSNTMMNGMDKIASQNIIHYETGHFEIFAKGYYREEGMFPLDTIIDDPDPLYRIVRDIKGVGGVTQRVKFPARVNNGIDEFPVLAIGINTQTESDVFKTDKAVVAGRYIDSAEDILVGTELSKIMNVEEGSLLTIITRDKYGTYNAYDFIVAGLINTEHPLFDGNAVVMDIAVAQELLSLGKGVTEISVKIRDESRISEMKKTIISVIGDDYEVYTYKELYASIFEISGFKRIMQFMIALVVVIIAAVGIINTMLMAVMERIPEIGTLKAMGFQNLDIVKMFLYEGGIIGVFGSFMGCFYGLLISLFIIFVGIDLSSFFDSSELGYPVRFVLKGEIDPGMMLVVFAFGVFVSVMVTLWPVRRATKLQPVDALRHV